jgi:death on curing protein
MIIWIERPLGLAIHERQLSEHGGSIGVRDETLRDSALARRKRLHANGDPPPDLLDLAASLAFGLVRNHPFVDDSKRTAHVCYRVFLALNGVDITASDEDKYVAMISLAEGSQSEAEFAEWLRKHIKDDAETRANEPRACYAR